MLETMQSSLSSLSLRIIFFVISSLSMPSMGLLLSLLTFFYEIKFFHVYSGLIAALECTS